MITQNNIYTFIIALKLLRNNLGELDAIELASASNSEMKEVLKLSSKNIKSLIESLEKEKEKYEDCIV